MEKSNIKIHGMPNIPPEKRWELGQKLLRIWKRGGMMSLEPLSLAEKKIMLLKPLEAEADGSIEACYNRFDSEPSDAMRCDVVAGTLSSGSMDTRFSQCALASSSLLALYSTEFTVHTRDDIVAENDAPVGWLNYILGTEYGDRMYADPWLVYRVLHGTGCPTDELLDMAFASRNTSVSGLGKLLCIANYPHNVSELDFADAKKDFDSDDESMISPHDALVLTDRYIRDLKSEGTESSEEKVTRLMELVRYRNEDILDDMEIEEKRLYGRILMVLRRTYPEIVIRVIAEVFSLDFWSMLNELEPSFASPAFPIPCPPVKPVNTATFLAMDADDLLLTGLGDEHDCFHPDTVRWMDEIRGRLGGLEAADASFDSDSFVDALVSALHDADRAYPGTYADKSMYDEFTARWDEPKVQASVRLLRQLIEEHQEDGEPRMLSVTDPLAGRLLVKRYLALLANIPLRKKYLGF